LAFVFAWHRIGAIGAYEKRVPSVSRRSAGKNPQKARGSS